MLKEQSKNQPANAEYKKRRSKKTGGNMSSVFVSRWVGPTFSPQDTADHSGIQKFIIGQTKCHVDSRREQRVPSK